MLPGADLAVSLSCTSFGSRLNPSPCAFFGSRLYVALGGRPQLTPLRDSLAAGWARWAAVLTHPDLPAARPLLRARVCLPAADPASCVLGYHESPSQCSATRGGGLHFFIRIYTCWRWAAGAGMIISMVVGTHASALANCDPAERLRRRHLHQHAAVEAAALMVSGAMAGASGGRYACPAGVSPAVRHACLGAGPGCGVSAASAPCCPLIGARSDPLSERCTGARRDIPASRA